MFVDVWKVLKAMDETAQVKSDKASGSVSFLAKSSYCRVILIIFRPFFPQLLHQTVHHLAVKTRFARKVLNLQYAPATLVTKVTDTTAQVRMTRYYMKTGGLSREKEIRSVSVSTINEVTAKKPGWFVFVEVTLYLALLSRSHGRYTIVFHGRTVGWLLATPSLAAHVSCLY